MQTAEAPEPSLAQAEPPQLSQPLCRWKMVYLVYALKNNVLQMLASLLNPHLWRHCNTAAMSCARQPMQNRIKQNSLFNFAIMPWGLPCRDRICKTGQMLLSTSDCGPAVHRSHWVMWTLASHEFLSPPALLPTAQYNLAQLAQKDSSKDRDVTARKMQNTMKCAKHKRVRGTCLLTVGTNFNRNIKLFHYALTVH